MKTVKLAINADLWEDLEPEIADIDADSVVGEAVVTLLNRVALVLETSASDGGGLEDSVRDTFIDAALHQANVWYFG